MPCLPNPESTKRVFTPSQGCASSFLNGLRQAARAVVRASGLRVKRSSSRPSTKAKEEGTNRESHPKVTARLDQPKVANQQRKTVAGNRRTVSPRRRPALAVSSRESSYEPRQEERHEGRKTVRQTTRKDRSKDRQIPLMWRDQ